MRQRSQEEARLRAEVLELQRALAAAQALSAARQQPPRGEELVQWLRGLTPEQARQAKQFLMTGGPRHSDS